MGRLYNAALSTSRGHALTCDGRALLDLDQPAEREKLSNPRSIRPPATPPEYAGFAVIAPL